MSADGGTAVSAPPPTLRRRSPYFWLGLLVVAYFVVSLVLSYIRVLEFTVSNWDLGIFQQALWSTSHGRVLYEAGDWESFGSVSFLQVHPAPVLLLLVPLYSIYPTPLTLLTVQSAGVALSAVPVYWIGLRVFAESRRALAMAAVYLAFAPTLTSNLYDFHLEAFLPLEVLLLLLFWTEGRYLWGFAVAVTAFLTLEVAPFLVAAIAIYSLLEPIEAYLPWGRGRSTRVPHVLRHWLRPESVRAYLARRTVRFSLLLLGVAAVAYALLRVFEWWVVPILLGAPPSPPAGTGSVLAVASTSGIGLNFAFLAHIDVKLTYWVLLVGLLGFLPLLAPRALILSLPWFFFTLQSGQAAWSRLGFQYGFVAAPALLVAAIYGLRNFEENILPSLRSLVARAFPDRPRPEMPRRWGLPRQVAGLRRLLPALLLAALLAVNLSFTPVNPQRQDLQSALSAYRVSYHVPVGYGGVAEAADLFPPDAVILASDDLFPFVANDVHSYSLLWTPAQPVYLPFNTTTLPPFVFLCSAQFFAVPDWLWPQLSNFSVYGLRAIVPGSPVGDVLLYEMGYTGPLQIIGGNMGGFSTPPYRG